MVLTAGMLYRQLFKLIYYIKSNLKVEVYFFNKIISPFISTLIYTFHTKNYHF